MEENCYTGILDTYCGENALEKAAIEYTIVGVACFSILICCCLKCFCC